MTLSLRWLLRLSTLLGAFILVIHPTQAQQVCPTGYPQTTPNSDFADTGNGMVQHVPTGLIWKRCAEGQTWDGSTCTGTAASYTWQAAFQRADDVNANTAGTQNLGQTDWRVPNINELKSLVEQGCYNPAINGAQFPNTPASDFWSASPYAGISDYAWDVDFDDGYDDWFRRSDAYRVRLVRAGQSFLNFDAALGTVTVSKTLMGTAAASVPAGTTFPITLTCGATTLGPLNATTTTPAVFTNVPLVSCTVAEGVLPALAGVSWGAPTYNPANPLNVTAGANLAVTVTNTANAATYTVTATAGAGGSISPASRTVNHGQTTTFTVTPNAGYTATVSGCGGALVNTTYTTGPIITNCTVTASFSQTSVPPTLGGTPPQGTVGQAYSFTPTVTGTPPITFSATGLPAGLNINPNTGAITGTPTAAGTFTVNITASNSAGPVTQPFTLVIAAAAVGTGQPIPTLSEWAMLLMALAFGLLLWRRRNSA